MKTSITNNGTYSKEALGKKMQQVEKVEMKSNIENLIMLNLSVCKFNARKMFVIF